MKKLSRFGLWALLFSSAFTLVASLTAINAFSFIYDGSFYPFALPAVFLYALSALASGVGLKWPGTRSVLLWLAAIAGVPSYFGFRYAMARWPGGDDGPGLFWLFFVGGGSTVLSIVSSVVLLSAATLVALRKG